MPTPERTCCACGTKRAQSALFRIASRDGSEPHFDTAKRIPGRGAYLCPRAECVERALKRRAIERALKLQAPLASSWKDELRRIVANAGEPVSTTQPEPQSQG